ncbi:MAG TPA: hypothetical protein VHB70_07225 [Parafilimonas sp.]|nr:hypothetical protein [Parafilimonas sp.]
MLFVKLTSRQVADYSYACTKLQTTLLKMHQARKVLEEIAASSFNKSLIKGIQLFISESLQFEQEISSQMNSFNCMQFYKQLSKENKESDVFVLPDDIEKVCNYVEENYIKCHRRLLRDKYLDNSLKRLINNQLQTFLFNITQLRLLNEVEPALNVHVAIN